KWVRAHAQRFGGDPDRILLVGHSAGAYNAGMLALDPRWLGEDRKAVRGFVGLSGPYDFLPDDTKDTRAAFAGVADPEATQPIRFASRDDPPSFLAAGGRDRLVLPSQTTGLAIALGEAGAVVTTRIYPELGHVGIVTALARPFRGNAPVLDDIVAFARPAAGDAPGAEAAAQ
ncbi:MAG TPA: alpha/beta hydrolase, partial [Allosphingosinicella sp.]